jgi:hypothetical protein
MKERQHVPMSLQQVQSPLRSSPLTQELDENQSIKPKVVQPRNDDNPFAQQSSTHIPFHAMRPPQSIKRETHQSKLSADLSTKNLQNQKADHKRSASVGSIKENNSDIHTFHVTNPDPDLSPTTKLTQSPKQVEKPQPAPIFMQPPLVSEKKKAPVRTNSVESIKIVSKLHTSPPSLGTDPKKTKIGNVPLALSATQETVTRLETEKTRLRIELDKSKKDSQAKLSESNAKVEEMRRKIIGVIEESEYMKMKIQLLLQDAPQSEVLTHERTRVLQLESTGNVLAEQNKSLIGQLQNANAALADEHKSRLLAERSVKENYQNLHLFDQSWKKVLETVTSSVESVSANFKQYESVINNLSGEITRCQQEGKFDSEKAGTMQKPLKTIDENIFDVKSILASLSAALKSLFEFRDQWCVNQSAATKLALENVEHEKQLSMLKYTILSLARKVHEKDEEITKLECRIKSGTRIAEDRKLSMSSNDYRDSSIKANPESLSKSVNFVDVPLVVVDALKDDILEVVEHANEMKIAYTRWKDGAVGPSFSFEEFFNKLDTRIHNLQVTYQLFSEEVAAQPIKKAASSSSSTSPVIVDQEPPMTSYMSKIVASLQEEIGGIKEMMESTGASLIKEFNMRTTESDMLHEIGQLLDAHLSTVGEVDTSGATTLVAKLKLCLSQQSQEKETQKTNLSSKSHSDSENESSEHNSLLKVDQPSKNSAYLQSRELLSSFRMNTSQSTLVEEKEAPREQGISSALQSKSRLVDLPSPKTSDNGPVENLNMVTSETEPPKPPPKIPRKKRENYLPTPSRALHKTASVESIGEEY